ncbi:MAG: hypothetical protein QXT33_05370 [Thermofilum sp.]
MEEITLDAFMRKLAGKSIRIRGICAPPPCVIVESLGQVYKVRVK